MFGPDFIRAKSTWLYPAEPVQWLWRGVLIFAVLAVIDVVMQSVGGIAIFVLFFKHGATEVSGFADGLPVDLLKAGIIGMLPSAIVVIACALYLGQFGMPHRQGRLLLDIPKLGVLGWSIILIGFTVLMYAIFIGTFSLLGIDPETYSPSGGLSDNSNSAGMVEKTMAEFAKDPILFALALPGVVLAAPLTEEILFRGALFSAIVNSPLGRIGAVLITSALWALMHRLSPAPWLFVGVLFLMGIALGVLLLRFGSLWVTIACHTLWNTINSLAIFGVGSHH
jgi:uncharacterized protein